MAKRPIIAKSEGESGPGAELLAICQRITEHGKLSLEGIKELIGWLRINKSANLQAKDYLSETVSKITADRNITRDEHHELYVAIETVLPPDVRKLVVRRRKLVEAERKARLKQAKAEQKQREKDEKARELAAAGVVMLTGKNGRQYQLHSLVGRVEYGEKTIAGIAEELGAEVAAIVEQNVLARERRFSGTVVSQTAAAWLIRLAQGGDHWLPKCSTRILRSDPVSGQVEIAISPSMAAQIDSQPIPRNLVCFTTPQVAARFNVSVDTVRKWIRDGNLGADSVGNGSAAFEYQIPEAELQRFAAQHGHRW